MPFQRNCCCRKRAFVSFLTGKNLGRRGETLPIGFSSNELFLFLFSFQNDQRTFVGMEPTKSCGLEFGPQNASIHRRISHNGQMRGIFINRQVLLMNVGKWQCVWPFQNIFLEVCISKGQKEKECAMTKGSSYTIQRRKAVLVSGFIGRIPSSLFKDTCKSTPTYFFITYVEIFNDPIPWFR